MSDYDFFSGLYVSEISVLHVKFRVDPSLEPGDRQIGIGLGHEVVSLDDPSRVRLVLNVGINADDPEAFEARGFVYEIALSGVFGADDLAESDERKAFVLINGLSLLYAEARSYLLQFSSTGPLGRLVLPSVSIPSYLKAAQEAREDSCDEGTAESVDD